MRTATYLWLYLIGALLIPGRPFYTAVYFLGGVYLLTRLSLEMAMRRMQVERELSEQRIFPGESLTVTLRFTNATGVPLPWVHFLESRPAQMALAPFSGVMPLGAREAAAVSYTITGSRRGRYELGPLTYASGDPFGFGRLGGGLDRVDQLIVYPRVSHLPELGLPARLPMGDLATRRRLFEDPAWLAGTREYVPGDSLKRVHWNATARTGELMVKQFRHAMLLPSCILLNLNREEYPSKSFWMESELGITAAASLCRYLVAQKQQVAFMASGTEPVRLPLRQGTGALMGVLETLACIEGGSGQDFTTLVADEARQMPWGTLFCLITPRETPALAALCARLAASGQQVLLFLTGAGGGTGAVAEPGRRPGGYHVYRLTESRTGEVEVG